jgi:hypothetical protein
MNPAQLLSDTASWTILAIAILFLIIDKKTRGWLSTYIRVMISRGEQVFVTIRAVNDRYYRPGKFVEQKFLRIKGQNKKNQLYHIKDDKHLYHAFGGLLAVDVDEAKGSVIIPANYKLSKYDNPTTDEKNTISHNGEMQEISESCYNPAAEDDLYETTLNKPEVKNFKKLARENLINIIALIASIVAVYMIYQVTQRQDMLYEIISGVKDCACSTAAVIK